MIVTEATAGTILCRNYVNGHWAESKSQKIVERRNPANTDDLVARIPLSTRQETKEAIIAGKSALPAWRDTPAPARGNILFKATRLMQDQKDDLARLLTREEGKALKDSLGEVQRAINILEFMAGEARRLTGETLPSELPKNFSYTIRQPLGVVGIITPWNFPVAIPVWKIAPALVCGNTVVFKPATLTPLTAMRIVEIFEQAGLPAGVLNLVMGSGKETGDELVQNPHVHGLSFTGSNEVGSQLYASGALCMKKCQCEMGGKNPIIILSDADLQLAMESALFGAFASTGQRCTATSRVIIEESIADRWVAMLVDRAKKFTVGDGLEPGIEMGPSVDESQMNTVLHFIDVGKKEAELKCGGERLTGPRYDKGWFVAPTVFDHVRADSAIAQEEIFGPVLSVIRVKNFDEALDVANSVRYGLTSSIYTTDSNKIFEFIDKVEAGMAHVNSPTVGGEAHVPFGGTKGTSVGPKEVGRSALDFYSELKIVYIDYTGRKRESSIY
ncbi:MAG TPA: aldehyde dehydrogenase family protein [Candidatus Limnocylindrales bacterium]|nr:aldehyde dehydrogenase family protein [Candidatus Limnocylindrales bacterium]